MAYKITYTHSQELQEMPICVSVETPLVPTSLREFEEETDEARAGASEQGA